jgi:hypothetical protein
MLIVSPSDWNSLISDRIFQIAASRSQLPDRSFQIATSFGLSFDIFAFIFEWRATHRSKRTCATST